jgi:hypothetical protein
LEKIEEERVNEKICRRRNGETIRKLGHFITDCERIRNRLIGKVLEGKSIR